MLRMSSAAGAAGRCNTGNTIQTFCCLAGVSDGGDSEAPGLIEGFLDCSALLAGRRPDGGSARGSPRAGSGSGGQSSPPSDDFEGAEVLEWEERGIWYTPPDADLDVEGAPICETRLRKGGLSKTGG